jgi:hypothetical protein
MAAGFFCRFLIEIQDFFFKTSILYRYLVVYLNLLIYINGVVPSAIFPYFHIKSPSQFFLNLQCMFLIFFVEVSVKNVFFSKLQSWISNDSDVLNPIDQLNAFLFNPDPAKTE